MRRIVNRLDRKPNVHYILVYDFGGGTLDVSVLHVSDGSVAVLGSEGDEFLGGADFDNPSHPQNQKFSSAQGDCLLQHSCVHRRSN